MRPTQSLPNFNGATMKSSQLTDQAGFTIMELLVAMVLSTVIFGLIVQTLISQSDLYMEDVGRTRIQQNMRGALDILAMNIRQAGEGFDGSFPAILVTDGASGAPDELVIRRNLLSEVHILCKPGSSGDTQIYISDNSSSATECIPANVATGVATWSAYRTAEGGAIAVYVFDRVGKTGEFLQYTGEGVSSGDNYLTIGSLGANYPINSTSVYVIEEFRFRLDELTNTLELLLDGDTATPQDVAYEVTDFQVEVDLQDGTTVTAMSEASAHDWKDTLRVRVVLDGREQWKSRVFQRSVTGEYFPRNVLSG